MQMPYILWNIFNKIKKMRLIIMKKKTHNESKIVVKNKQMSIDLLLATFVICRVRLLNRNTL